MKNITNMWLKILKVVFEHSLGWVTGLNAARLHTWGHPRGTTTKHPYFLCLKHIKNMLPLVHKGCGSILPATLPLLILNFE